ncbi:MAG: energy transducer TonB [Blastochloris sp.]|nr:energy transducer TonB [Blastochloris sp.]
METPPQPAGTRVQFLGALSGREVLTKKDFPQPAVSDVLRVTILNVGVGAEGSVEAVMVEETSLDSAVDQMAVQSIRQWKFKPRSGKALDWGRVIVYWDYQNKPRPGAAPGVNPP